MKKPTAKKPTLKKTVPVSAKSVAVKTEAKKSKPAPVKAAKPAIAASAVNAAPLKKTAPKASAAKAETVEAAPKRLVKLFFIEVKPGAERVIKRGDKSLAAPIPMDIQARRKDTAAEETPEELVERIERELQHQSFFKRNSLKPQMCTKCGVNIVTEKFTIDRELGYCESCAEILRLGATKEARRMEFNPTLKKEGEGAVAPVAAAESEPVPEAEGDEEPIPDID